MLTRALLIANVAVYGWTWAHHALDSDRGLFDAGAFWGPAVATGQWWRVFTSAFLHGGFLHIATNMFVLWQVGQIVETLFGSVRMAIVYLIAILGFGAALYVFDFNSLTVGASGAIFGLVGAFGAAGLRLGEPGRELVRSAFGFIVLNVVIALVVPNISQVGHMGGLVAGFLAGLALYRKPRPQAYAYAEPAYASEAIEGERTP